MHLRDSAEFTAISFHRSYAKYGMAIIVAGCRKGMPIPPETAVKHQRIVKESSRLFRFATEELALQQGIRYRRAIECDEAILAPRAALVNSPRNHFLASPGLALNQDGRIHRRDYVDVVEQSTELRAVSDQI